MDFGIYVHYPLCRRRCGYCDFAIVPQNTYKQLFPQQEYADQVCAEIAWRADDFANRGLKSVYFGGGTPSLWPAACIAQVIDTISQRWRVDQTVEITLEVNPEDVDLAALSAYQRAGINRISLGAQSVDDAWLKRLSREHSAEQVVKAVDLALEAGFANISADLIVGVATQSIDSIVQQAQRLCAMPLAHVSIYGLTLSPHAPLRRRGIAPASSDTTAQALQDLRQTLGEGGYQQYEVSNYAHPNYHSRHNQLVWRGYEYMGVGTSAHSFAIVDDAPWGIHSANPPFSRYMRATRCAGAPRQMSGATLDPLSAPMRVRELIMLGLRTCEGICRQRFAQWIGEDIAGVCGGLLTDLQNDGLVTLDDLALKPTAEGIWQADELALRLT